MKVRVHLLPAGNEDRDDHHVANMSALSVADVLRKRYADAHCEEHPDPEAAVTVVAKPEGDVHVDKAALCCEAFGEKIVAA